MKVAAGQGWFATLSSDAEAGCRLHAESFRGEEQLKLSQEEAQALIAKYWRGRNEIMIASLLYRTKLSESDSIPV
jgi:hypothetical protein